MAAGLLVFIVFVVLFLLYHLVYKRWGLPPGPLPLPFYGNVIALNRSRRWEFQFLDWKRKFGAIYTYWVGELPIVSVNDYRLCVRLFVEQADAFADRCAPEHFLRYTREGAVSGVIFTSGHLWQDQRRFALRVIKDFGYNGKELQEKILDELRTVIENVNEEIEAGVEEFDLHRHTDVAVGSIISNLLFGLRFTKENKDEFYRLKRRTTQIISSFSDPITNVARFNKFFFDLTHFYSKRVIEAFGDVYQFLDKHIQEHLGHGICEQPHDFVDAFFAEREKLERTGGNTAAFYTIPQLKGMGFDIFFAGQETTSSTITWILAFLITHPEAQKKLHEELDRVVGSERMITVADKPQLYFLQAANIFSQNVLREASRDVEIDGISIKKGTCIIPQLSAIHYDPEVFPQPEEFRPERFLDAEGKFKKIPELIAFSLGETMARMELFLFIGNLLNHYELLPATVPPKLERFPTPGANAMGAYKCRVRRRF
ncbi:(pine wood nematode) hypothetical protein [Aphelenchoides fujianensis]|nr:(pine wood nematode) hypothetical protein [Aphelenchoides fujianensis]